MNEILSRVLHNPENEKVLPFIRIDQDAETAIYFKAFDESYSGFDEGGWIFFDDYGEHVPDDCKYSLGICSVMLNTITGEIFAFNRGRFSVFFKCDFVRAGVENTNDLRTGYTLDCISDISELGDSWCFMNAFEEPKNQLQWSYELTVTKQ